MGVAMAAEVQDSAAQRDHRSQRVGRGRFHADLRRAGKVKIGDRHTRQAWSLPTSMCLLHERHACLSESNSSWRSLWEERAWG